jgi:hypothetical protein
MNLASGLWHWSNLFNPAFSPLGAKTNDDNMRFEKVRYHPIGTWTVSPHFLIFFLLN